MLEYVHELPTSIQREGVTHASTKGSFYKPR